MNLGKYYLPPLCLITKEPCFCRSTDQIGPVSRLGSKIKDVIKGAIDGAPLEATEVPTVWDALSDTQV